MKIPFVGPDIEQAISHTFRLTFLHNIWPILLVIGIIILIGWSLYKPGRLKILMLIGLGALFLSFEYNKHIMEALRQQTQVTLTTDVPNYRFIWIVDKLITRIIPTGLFVVGWGSVIVSIVLYVRKRRML